MFGKHFVGELISRSADNDADRRRFLHQASVAGLGLTAAGLAASLPGTALASTAGSDDADAAISDGAILNFALNLEYLEAEFYSYATKGHGLPSSMTGGKGELGGVTGGHKVPFRSMFIRQAAEEITGDEHDHVQFLRTALGGAKVARPKINLKYAFTAAARAAGLITAYKGAAPLISSKTYLGAAAGILAVEAYHAATIRTLIFERGQCFDSSKISAARNALDSKSGAPHRDQGTIRHGKVNIVPANSSGLACSRTPGQVLNIVYLTADKARRGGFFPAGVNGSINTSG